MSILIESYAVDTGALARLLAQPLWQTLLDARDLHAADRDYEVRFGVHDLAHRRIYQVHRDRGLLSVDPLSGVVALSDEELAADPFLNSSTGDYLTRPHGSSLSLMFLLRDVPAFQGVRYALELGPNDRRWWLLSALHAARGLGASSALDADEFAHYVGRILRVFGTDCPVPA